MSPRDTDQRLERLRRRAEEIAGGKPRPKDLADALTLAQELTVHQVELEMQNDELRSTQAELTSARELYQKLFDLAPVGFLVLDQERRILQANSAAYEILFPTAHQRLEGTGLLKWVHRDSLEVLARHLAETRTKRGPEGVVCEAVFTSGNREVVVEMHTVSLSMVDHTPGYLTALTDITRRKRQERELLRSQRELAQERARLMTVVEQMPAGLLLAEAPSGAIVLQNTEADKIRCHPQAEPASVEEYGNYGRLEDADGEPLALERYPLARAIRQGETVTQERFHYRCADGESKVLSINAAPVRDEEGAIRAAIAAFQDVTQDEANRRELARLNQDLERLVTERTAELEARTVSLGEANTALKVLMDNRQHEHEAQEEAVLANLNRLVIPLIERLEEAQSPEMVSALLASLRSNLKDLTSGFSQRLTSVQYQLSPRELEVARLIKDGKTSDQISDILGISTSSVLFHRNNIRKKLGLKGKKTRLANQLQRLS